MKDRRDPDYIADLVMCNTCGRVLGIGDKYSMRSDGEIMCLRCIEEELFEVEERERRSVEEIF